MRGCGAGKKAKEENEGEKAGEGASGAQEKLEALKKRALARRESGVGKKARLAPKH